MHQLIYCFVKARIMFIPYRCSRNDQQEAIFLEEVDLSVLAPVRTLNPWRIKQAYEMLTNIRQVIKVTRSSPALSSSYYHQVRKEMQGTYFLI